MMKPKKTKSPKWFVALPCGRDDAVRKQLREEADANKRSVSAQALIIIEKHFAKAQAAAEQTENNIS